ncbi:tyrosine-type recombinase/integrase [Undibacterium sp.]|uniref:tyrosine-type recombinase/integrase n=1 Tax=Undibacterium sp. TaxID=1914977 RepID=UPI0027311C4C|nr:tyrosine-type recombinase/integrase [Undibacterium sp.]MDP1976285.1 tyrosine-type recombinase/integrase [Undibacterium sp.]
MARIRTKNFDLPIGMLRRVKGPHIYYTLDMGGKPRKEIPLGKDYFLALKKYSELRIQANIERPTMQAAIDRYRNEELPKQADNTQKIFKYDIKHVEIYFGTAPLDEIKPVHIRKFLDKHRSTPTTANRCKRLFSTIFNNARGWGYTDAQNPCEGIRGHKLDKRTVYISDDLFNLVYKHASEPLKDAMELAYLTGQRPADALSMSEDDIVSGHLIIKQAKTKQPLRVIVQGQLKEVINRIHRRKDEYSIASGALLVNTQGKRLTQAVLRNHFHEARDLAIAENPELESSIINFWFYDLRAKAADDTSDLLGEQKAADLLGHDDVKTTRRHYLRRGKIVVPTR